MILKNYFFDFEVGEKASPDARLVWREYHAGKNGKNGSNQTSISLSKYEFRFSLIPELKDLSSRSS